MTTDSTKLTRAMFTLAEHDESYRWDICRRLVMHMSMDQMNCEWDFLFGPETEKSEPLVPLDET